MSYQVLARKCRPKIFTDVVGQEYVVKALVNSLESKRIHQVYLLSGTRGVGKTSLARIFAKALNCELGLSATPCGNCDSCRALDKAEFIDFYEIDAASHTKVEDVRELLTNVSYPPLKGRYKVYLIDEVHMLSGHSFNALLKTLEEPPAQVVFILATTEPKKLPITILSRCIQFYLRTMNSEQVLNYLKVLCQKEQLCYEEQALQILAQAADGSIRDALSLLEQAAVLCPTNLTSTAINEMLGYVNQNILIELLAALFNADTQAVFTIINQLHSYAPNYQQLLTTILQLLHQIALKQILADLTVNPAIASLSTITTPTTVQLYYQIGLRGQQDLPYAPTPAQGFEMIMLRMLCFQPVMPDSAMQEQLIKSPPTISPPSGTTNKITPTSTTPPQNNNMQLDSVAWSELLNNLQLTGLTKSLAAHCSLQSKTQDTLVLILAKQYQSMLNPKIISKLEQSLIDYLGHQITLQISLDDNNSDRDSPAALAAAHNKLLRKEQLDKLAKTPEISQLSAAFDAQIYLPNDDT
jgi:DNA polymerase-3 subunit gamma/tau